MLLVYQAQGKFSTDSHVGSDSLRLLRDNIHNRSRLHNVTTTAVYHGRGTPTFPYFLSMRKNTHTHTLGRPAVCLRLPVSVLVVRENP